MKKTIVCILIAMMCVIVVFPRCVYANNQINTEDLKQIYDGQDSSQVIGMGEKVLGVVQVIGVAAGIICLIILGIKYMMMSASADDKAKIKEKLIPYVIGAILLFGGSGLLSVVAHYANKMDVPGTGNYNTQTDSNYTVSCPYCGAQVPGNLPVCMSCNRRF